MSHPPPDTEPARQVEDRGEAQSVWSCIREALGGSHQDFTTGPLNRAILLLSIPMVLEMVMESLFAVVDVFVVARVGSAAVATVGLSESILTVFYALAVGLSIGIIAVVSRRTGEKDPDRAARAAVQGILLGLIVSVPLAIAGAAFAPRLLEAMGASADVVETGGMYASVLYASTPSIMLLFIINATFRGAGDAAIAMRTLWLANGINLVLAPCLVLGLGPFPRLGVTGAAIATTIGRSTGVLFQLYQLTRGRSRIAVRREHFVWEGATLRTMLRLSSVGLVQSLIAMASWVLLVRIVARFGSQTVAGYTIAIRIVIFALLPSWGLSNAAATLVGQNLGAGRPDRAERCVWLAGLWNLGFLGLVGALFVVLAEPIVGAFDDTPEVAAVAARCLRIVSAGFPFYAYGMVLTQAFNGAGATWTPTFINLACYWILELPLAYALAIHAGLGPTGAFIAVAVAFSTLAVASAAVFRRGTWKLQRV